MIIPPSLNEHHDPKALTVKTVVVYSRAFFGGVKKSGPNETNWSAQLQGGEFEVFFLGGEIEEELEREKTKRTSKK